MEETGTKRQREELVTWGTGDKGRGGGARYKRGVCWSMASFAEKGVALGMVLVVSQKTMAMGKLREAELVLQLQGKHISVPRFTTSPFPIGNVVARQT